MKIKYKTTQSKNLDPAYSEIKITKNDKGEASQIEYITPKVVTKNLTDEQKKILKIFSSNNYLQYQDLIRSTPEQIDRMVKRYYEEKPIIDDLNTLGIQINILSDMKYPDFNKKSYEKAIPTLVDWLKKKDLSYHVKASIIGALIVKPISKQYAFDTIIELFKTADRNYRDENGFQTDLFIYLGNAFTRWVDDSHANTVFDLLKYKHNKEDGFLLSSLINLKKPENKQNAIELLMNEMQIQDQTNGLLLTSIAALRKLKAIKAKPLLESFTTYPKNYIRTKAMDEKEHGFVSDTEVRNEAKKAIKSFNKILDNTP